MSSIPISCISREKLLIQITLISSKHLSFEHEEVVPPHEVDIFCLLAYGTEKSCRKQTPSRYPIGRDNQNSAIFLHRKAFGVLCKEGIFMFCQKEDVDLTSLKYRSHLSVAAPRFKQCREKNAEHECREDG